MHSLNSVFFLSGTFESTVNMGNVIVLMHIITYSTDCGIHHTPEKRQVKLMCDGPHLCQFIPIQAKILFNVIHCIHLFYKTSLECSPVNLHTIAIVKSSWHFTNFLYKKSKYFF